MIEFLPLTSSWVRVSVGLVIKLVRGFMLHREYIVCITFDYVSAY